MKGERKALLSLCLGAALMSVPAYAGLGQSGKTVRVTIHRLAQVDNLDKGDQLTRDDADFFAIVTINGVESRTLNMSRDDGKPGWVVSGVASGNMCDITIQVMDDDGGIEKGDDHVDINPKMGKKNLDMRFNVKSGRITGDAKGRRNKVIHSGGLGDSDRARIWFKVQ